VYIAKSIERGTATAEMARAGEAGTGAVLQSSELASFFFVCKLVRGL
jgi:hypothetical protein